MKKNLLTVFLFVALSWQHHVFAQDDNIYFDKLDIKSGLPESSVNDMLEDKNGYIWMATQNGLVRYDGYQCKVYRLGAKHGTMQKSSNIISLYLDKKGVLWAGTISNGIFKFEPETDSFKEFPFKDAQRTSFYIEFTDADGNLWGKSEVELGKAFIWKLNVTTGAFEVFGKNAKGINYFNGEVKRIRISKAGAIWITSSNGLYKYNKAKAFTGYFTTKDSLNQTNVALIYEAPSQPGVLWLSLSTQKSNRLVKFDTKTGKALDIIPANDILESSRAISIFEDKQKRLWFTSVAGLSMYTRTSQKFTHYPPNFPAHPDVYALTDIVEDLDGFFWMTYPYGLVKFDPATGIYKLYEHDANKKGSFNGSSIAVKMLDHTGTLWVGSSHFGVNKISKYKSAIEAHTASEGKKNGYPGGNSYFSVDNTGVLWFVNDSKSIYSWDGKDTFTEVIHSNPEDKAYFMDVCPDNKGNLYIPGYNFLMCYNIEKKTKEYFYFETAQNETFFAHNLFIDSQGLVWMCVGGSDGKQNVSRGVSSFNPATKQITAYPYRKTFDPVTPKNAGALDDERAVSIYEDKNHTIWVGTNWGGINKFDRKTSKFVSSVTGPAKDMRCITDMLQDAKGRFWVTSYLYGVFIYDIKTGTVIKNFTEETGLLFNSTLRISQDKAGQIWITSERGLSRIDPETFRIKNFPMSSILSDNDIMPYGRTLILKNGNIAVPLMEGFAVLNPARLKENKNAPRVVLENVVYRDPYSKDKGTVLYVNGRKELKLPYNLNRIQFDYVGLQFDNPAENTYAYKLEGYDKNWIQAGTQRSINYTNLAPGTYVFYVKAANSDGVWSPALKGITIIISPPWYNTWWAYVLYIVVFATGLRLYIVYRSRSLRKKNMQLEEQVAQRTAELQQSLAELTQTQTQLIQSEKMASLGELTAGIAHEIQNPLNFVNNFSDVSIELIDEMVEELDKDDTEEAKAIATDIKQNLEKIAHHGRRADGIVKGMLQHSRASSGQKEPTDINKLADEYLRLAYHGLRAKDKSFNADLVTNFSEGLPKVSIISQDVGRVLLNLFTNAFYATNQKKQTDGTYKPTVEVVTSQEGNAIIITVKDNGTGIPDAIKDKILQPFFTTKPTGQGTGLGLSLSYDIVVKGHGGTIDIESKEGEGSAFKITLPITA